VVTKADRIERIDCFAGFMHGLDVVFIPARRYIGPPKSAVTIHSNIVGVYSHNRLHRVRDVANASGVILASNAMCTPLPMQTLPLPVRRSPAATPMAVLLLPVVL